MMVHCLDKLVDGPAGFGAFLSGMSVPAPTVTDDAHFGTASPTGSSSRARPMARARAYGTWCRGESSTACGRTGTRS